MSALSSPRRAITGLGMAALLGGAALLLAFLPLLYAAALVVGLIFVAFVLHDPVWGLYGAVLSVPVQEIVGLPAGLTVTQAVVALAAGAWVLRALAYPER